MSELNVLGRVMVTVAVLSAFMVASTAAYANENMSKSAIEMSDEKASAKAQETRNDRKKRFFSDPRMLPQGVRDKYKIRLPGDVAPGDVATGMVGNDDFETKAFGSGNHPFTTKRASSLSSLNPDVSSIEPVNKFPWRATGKLIMNFGNETFVCTASVIRKGLLVTAAHCVHNFGQKNDGFADHITFEPARHESSRPFGTWTARQWWVPRVYWDGTDECAPEAPGIVCENDVAVIVVNKSEGKFVGDVVGTYDVITKDDFGYADFLNEKSAQITQLGYPAENFPGDRMIRTDSVGYQDDPNNVIIGSNQTGGSSGGPWLQNFGVKEAFFAGTPPTDSESNRVSGTTSWGYISDAVKVQGASRFGKNKAYTTKSNIQSLIDGACGANPGFC